VSVGGRVIEVAPHGDQLVRIWVVDSWGTETCVLAVPDDVMPGLGDEVWWQAGEVLFDGDRRSLKKVGASFAAPGPVGDP
jgi:hypothetical protein